MPHVAISLDAETAAALERRARAEGVTPEVAAREALARGLRTEPPRRSLRGIGKATLGETALEALGRLDWAAPAFSDAELDALEADEAARSRRG